jgi:hypothetical protein
MALTPRIIRVPDITEDDLATLWVGTEENMQLRGPARNALGQGPFAGGPVDPSLVEDEAVTAGGGAVSRISSSPEVDQDRAASAAERERQAAEEQAGEEQADTSSGQGPGGAVPPPRSRREDTANEEEQNPLEDEPEDQPPTAPALVRLVPSKPVYQVGERVVVQVVIDNAQDVGSTPFHLRYNPEVLQFIPPGSEGPFMRSDGANTVFLAADTGGGGEIVVGLSRMGAPEGVSGSGTLAVFEFTAIASGDCGFAFTGATIKDPQALNLPAGFNTASVRVE